MVQVHIISWMDRISPLREADTWPCHDVTGVGEAHSLITMALVDAETPAGIPRVGFYQSLPGFPVHGETAVGPGIRVEFHDSEADYQSFLAVLRSYAEILGVEIKEK